MNTRTFRWTTSKSLALSLIIMIALLAPLLLWSGGGARALIKDIPILNSAAWPMRWIVVLLPTVQLLLAAPVTALLARQTPRVATALVVIATTAIWIGPLFEQIGYYIDAGNYLGVPKLLSYDPKPVIESFNKSRVSGQIPITAVALNRQQPLTIDRNDTMLQGVSQGVC